MIYEDRNVCEGKENVCPLCKKGKKHPRFGRYEEFVGDLGKGK